VAKKSAKKSNGKKATKRAAKAAAKKRGVKKAKKTAKKVAKKIVKKAAKKAAKKPTKNLTKKPAKPSRPKTLAKASKPTTTPKLAAEALGAIKRAAQNAAAALAPTPKPAEPKTATSRGNRYYVTTAIAYPNGQPHIGHAYEAIATDAIARFARLDGKDTFFLTGTDEHGLKMVQTAQAEGLTTVDLAARNSGRTKSGCFSM